MIAYLKNEEIDRERWDNCLAEIAGVKPYPWSWYLDIMAPGWEALIDDDYATQSFRYHGFRKYGFNYIATPVFLQQLGVFTPDSDAARQSGRVHFIYTRGTYRLVDLNIAQEVKSAKYRVTPRSNFELKLDGFL